MPRRRTGTVTLL